MIVGKLASSIALTLMGKHKPIYTPAIDYGDYVVVTNAQKLAFTGEKLKRKIYYSHSGYPGGLGREKAWEMMERRPEEVLVRAVRGMLPKNRLRQLRLRRLKVFAGESNPYSANSAVSYEKHPQRLLSFK